MVESFSSFFLDVAAFAGGVLVREAPVVCAVAELFFAHLQTARVRISRFKKTRGEGKGECCDDVPFAGSKSLNSSNTRLYEFTKSRV